MFVASQMPASEGGRYKINTESLQLVRHQGCKEF
jgi:hypothetical protein